MRTDAITRPEALVADPTDRRCRSCGKLLLRMHALNGRVEVQCSRCRSPCVFFGDETARDVLEHLERAQAEQRRLAEERPRAPIVPTMSPHDLIRMMEQRWEAFTAARARRRAEVALGLRFEVFKRDRFRCRYCGVGVDDGAILHVDHVIARSQGGSTTLDNLVTACVECNLGKSDKPL